MVFTVGNALDFLTWGLIVISGTDWYNRGGIAGRGILVDMVKASFCEIPKIRDTTNSHCLLGKSHDIINIKKRPPQAISLDMKLLYRIFKML